MVMDIVLVMIILFIDRYFFKDVDYVVDNFWFLEFLCFFLVFCDKF